jgi:hypothetical protein
MGNFAKVLGLVVGSISTPSRLTPNVFESIETFNNLDAKTKINLPQFCEGEFTI